MAGETGAPDLLDRGLVLAVLVAAGGLAQGLLSGLGSHPVRRAVIGVLLLLIAVAAFSGRRRLRPLLRKEPRFVFALAALQLVLVVLDGVPGGPYFAVCLTSVGLMAVVSRMPRLVLACAGLLDIGYAAGVLAEHSPASLARGNELATATGALLAAPAVALVLLCLAFVFNALSRDLALAPSAISPAPPKRVIRLLPAPMPTGRASRPPTPRARAWTGLRPSELRMVSSLVRHGSEANVADALVLSKRTVENELTAALNKAGAQTLAQLAAMTAHPDWPPLPDDD